MTEYDIIEQLSDFHNKGILSLAEFEFAKKKLSKIKYKNKTIALLLSIFLGFYGIDRFYLGDIWIGILKLLTFGGFGILYIIDIVKIATRSIVIKGDKIIFDQNKVLDIFDEFERITDLYEGGALNNEEYGKYKKNLINKIYKT